MLPGDPRVRSVGDSWYLPDAQPYGVWFVDETAVEHYQLEHMRPGSIIPVHHLPAVQYVPPSADDYCRLAGMISDAA